MPRPTRAEKDRLAAYHELAETMRGLEEDLRWGLTDSLRIPRQWAEIATSPAVPKKQMLTIRLDEDVVAFFRAMGAGYLTRINAVLRTFMLARLAGVVAGPEGVSYGPSLDDQARALRREILDHAAAVTEAREAKEREAELREKVKGLTALRDSRVGK